MLNIEKIAKEIKLVENKTDKYKATYTLEPLYRGYGNTIGNALRRVLLSSIPGSAIKGMRIEGVLNEFTTLDGVKEAVTDIILNVKEIVIEQDEPGERRMSLNIVGPKIVTAADIKHDLGINIINKDQVIATVTTNRELKMEFLVDSGEGFVVSDEINKEGWEIDFLAVDAIYTPIKKVNYTVKDTMVGRVTNYDKLELEIVTDGSIEIQDALSYAVELLELHLKPFTNIGNAMAKYRDDEEIIEEIEEKNDYEDLKIEELNLSVRSYNSLKRAEIGTLGQLARLSIAEIEKIKNLGKVSLEEIVEKLKEYGFIVE